MGVILSENTAALEKLIDLANNLPDAEEGTQPVIESLSVTANGTYTAPDGVDGYSPVTVNVPIPDGYIVPSGTKAITENGTHDVTEYASVAVDVPTGGGDAFVSYINGTMETLTAEQLYGAVTIHDYSFHNNTILKSIEMPNTITSVGTNAFYSTSLVECKLSSAIVSIGVHAFSRCYYLDWGDLVLPEGLQTLSNYAFWYNRKMTSVVLPSTLTQMGIEVFRYCNHLKSVTVLATTPPTIGTNMFGGTLVEAIYVPAESLEAYKAATNWSNYAEMIKPISELEEGT